MATEPGAEKPKKKRKSLSFKNGLKSLKGKVKKSDDKNKNEDVGNTASPKTESNTMSYFEQQQQANNGKHKKRLSLSKKKKIERPRLPKLKLSDYTFPEQILPPSESWGKLQYDSEDHQIHEYLITKYKAQIEQLKFFPSDVIIRFTVSQRGMTPYSERQKETESHFRAYLKFHADNHYDDILLNEKLNCNKSLSQLKIDINALPLFIYGQDKQGHPIFWDDGIYRHNISTFYIPYIYHIYHIYKFALSPQNRIIYSI